MRIPSGKTDQVIYFVAVDSTDLKTRETGLSSFTVYRSRNGGAATAYTTPTVSELSSANMPGVYSLLIDEDTTIAAGSDSEEYCVHITQAAMAPVTRTIELYRRDTTTGTTITTSNIDAAISSRMATYTQPTGFLAATFPATVASTTNITAGTITTTTNVTTVNGLASNVITAASINTGAITAAKFAAGAIDAAAIATGAVDADALSTDAVTEIWAGSTAPSAATIADAVWDEDATAHQTQGTFGQAIGDPVADTNTIYKAVVTDATGATVGADVVAVKAETASILTDTAEIGTAGAGLTAINLPDQTMNIVGNITGNLSGSVGSVTGLTVGNLDAAVSTRLATAGYTAPDNAGVAGIKAKTDQFSFTVANQVDSNVQYVNDAQVNGNGQPGTEWGP